MKLIGRASEIEKFEKILKAKKSEFLTVYGRRRIGKTFLIREYFDNKFDFYATGLAKGNTAQQLTNFTTFINSCFSTNYEVPTTWLTAFNLLIKQLEENKTNKKQVIFIDEMPWMDTKKSDFMMGLEYFWNSWASAQKNIVLIVCGSAASWITNNLIKNTGGLYNRVTERMKLEPFTLSETKEYFNEKKIILDRYQIMQLYMVTGGIPYYLDQIEPGKSASQNIEDICFKNNGKLRTEFGHIFSSLFGVGQKHELVIKTIYEKGGALNREELIKHTNFSSGGGISKILNDLEESGFISKLQKFGLKKANVTYCISDFYTLFYFKYLINIGKYEPNMWLNKMNDAAYSVWAGLAFEQICFAHVPQIKRALNIGGVASNTYSWVVKGNAEKKGSQIDLVIDRRDQVINLFEIKFSINEFVITKEYDIKLRNKIQSFKEATNTRKSIFLTMLTTHGLKPNEYSTSAIQNQLTMDALFEK